MTYCFEKHCPHIQIWRSLSPKNGIIHDFNTWWTTMSSWSDVRKFIIVKRCYPLHTRFQLHGIAYGAPAENRTRRLRTASIYWIPYTTISLSSDVPKLIMMLSFLLWISSANLSAAMGPSLPAGVQLYDNTNWIVNSVCIQSTQSNWRGRRNIPKFIILKKYVSLFAIMASSLHSWVPLHGNQHWILKQKIQSTGPST